MFCQCLRLTTKERDSLFFFFPSTIQYGCQDFSLCIFLQVSTNKAINKRAFMDMTNELSKTTFPIVFKELNDNGFICKFSTLKVTKKKCKFWKVTLRILITLQFLMGDVSGTVFPQKFNLIKSCFQIQVHNLPLRYMTKEISILKWTNLGEFFGIDLTEDGP